MPDFIRWRLDCLQAHETRHTKESIAIWRMVFVQHPFQALVIFLVLQHYVSLLPGGFGELSSPLVAFIGLMVVTALFEVGYDHGWRMLMKTQPPSWRDSFWDLVTATIMLVAVLPRWWELGYLGLWVGVMVVCAPSIAGKTWSRP